MKIVSQLFFKSNLIVYLKNAWYLHIYFDFMQKGRSVIQIEEISFSLNKMYMLLKKFEIFKLIFYEIYSDFVTIYIYIQIYITEM